MHAIMLRLTFFSMVVLAAGIFTSVSFSALSHIAIFLPGIYFTQKAIREKKLKNLPKSFWALLALSVTIILSVVFNWSSIENPVRNLAKVKYFILPIIGVFAYVEVFKTISEKQKKVLLNLFLVATTVATISGLIGVWSGYNPIKMKDACHATRACGLYGMYMTYGYGISLFMTLISAMLYYREHFKNYTSIPFLAGVWLINLVGLIISYSRGAWIGFAISLPLLFYKKNKALFFKIVIGITVIFSTALITSQTVKDMFFSRMSSDSKRIAFFQTAFVAFKEKPLLGWGYRNFEPNVKELKVKYKIPYEYFGGHAHNNLIEHLASTGIIGFIFCFLFFAFWLIETYKHAHFLFTFCSSFIVTGMFQYTFGDGENLFFVMFIWTLMMAWSIWPLKKDGVVSA